jgi:hypothetical protein
MVGHNVHTEYIGIEIKRGGGDVSAILYMMVNIVKGVGVHPPPSPAWANFSIMMECTPEHGSCHSVFTLWIYSRLVHPTGRQLPPLSSVLYGIISKRRSVLAAQLLLREKSGA